MTQSAGMFQEAPSATGSSREGTAERAEQQDTTNQELRQAIIDTNSMLEVMAANISELVAALKATLQTNQTETDKEVHQ